MPLSRRRCARTDPATVASVSPTAVPKNCRTNPSNGAIPPSSPVYPATPSWRRVAPSPPRRVPLGAASKSHGAFPWASPETAPSCSRSLPTSLVSTEPGQSSVRLVIPPTLIGEGVAVATQEVAPQSVKDCHPPAASRSGTDEPRPRSTEVAGRPSNPHRSLHIFPLGI